MKGVENSPKTSDDWFRAGSRMEAAKLEMLRFSLGKTRMGRIRNDGELMAKGWEIKSERPD